MRNAGEHSLDDASCLIHARHDDYHLRFNGMHCIRRDDTTAGPGRQTRVQLNDPLQLVDPNRAETLTPERISQSHAGNVPASEHS
ncbi:hypothetical protein Adu01nite_03780 [Paractinoplanes durhamensis]|uniref:Uncharacterized protein n=1 Tax=Paractinoplanes durhamensis TaxID=113563 RepID=A0ABQ3YN72_9ACTN|nr:hypothetical protein Adu01nite_03780 [Actinoplanes durhamensis]